MSGDYSVCVGHKDDTYLQRWTSGEQISRDEHLACVGTTDALLCNSSADHFSRLILS